MNGRWVLLCQAMEPTFFIFSQFKVILTKSIILLKHSVKAIEYRFIKATTGSNDNFGNFKISEHTRSPNEIVNYMFDLVVKTLTMIKEGHFNCRLPEALDFKAESLRFLSGLGELVEAMALYEINPDISKKLLQGPILDIATHIILDKLLC